MLAALASSSVQAIRGLLFEPMAMDGPEAGVPVIAKALSGSAMDCQSPATQRLTKMLRSAPVMPLQAKTYGAPVRIASTGSVLPVVDVSSVWGEVQFVPSQRAHWILPSEVGAEEDSAQATHGRPLL